MEVCLPIDSTHALECSPSGNLWGRDSSDLEAPLFKNTLCQAFLDSWFLIVIFLFLFGTVLGFACKAQLCFGFISFLGNFIEHILEQTAYKCSLKYYDFLSINGKAICPLFVWWSWQGKASLQKAKGGFEKMHRKMSYWKKTFYWSARSIWAKIKRSLRALDWHVPVPLPSGTFPFIPVGGAMPYASVPSAHRMLTPPL